jgi:hypothetical protein
MNTQTFIWALICTLSFSSSISAQINAFAPGEKLYYRIHWQNVDAGYAMVSVLQGSEDNVYKLETMARSSERFDNFFKIRDKIICEWNSKSGIPLVTEKFLQEGYYRRQYKVVYNHLNQSADYWQTEFKGNTDKYGKHNQNAYQTKKKGTVTDLPVNIQDIVSALFMMRADERDGIPGDHFAVQIFDDLHVSDLKMSIIAYDNIRVPAGIFSAMRILPQLSTSGFFISKGDILVWVSHDKFRYPLKVEATIPLAGKIIVELVKIKK